MQQAGELELPFRDWDIYKREKASNLPESHLRAARPAPLPREVWELVDEAVKPCMSRSVCVCKCKRVLPACSIPETTDAGGLAEVCGDQAICRATGQSDALCPQAATADVEAGGEGVTKVAFMDSTPKGMRFNPKLR